MRSIPGPSAQSVSTEDRETEWKNIVDKTNICATSKSNLATPVEQILNLSHSSNHPTPHTVEDEESLERYEKRILQKHQEMKDLAKQEYGHPNRFKHVKGFPITRLSPKDLPDLAEYAASPQGITDYHITQVNNNLSELLEGFSQSQLVIYSNIEEVEKDLIPKPLWPYFREYCNLMESEEFQFNTVGIPQIGLPP